MATRTKTNKRRTAIISMKLIVLLLLSLNVNILKSQLIITTTQTPDQLVQNILVGTGVTVTNVTFNSPASALNIGGMASTGAMIGSIIPGIGTAVGAGVGALVGVASEWKNITKSLSSIVGKLPEDFSAKFTGLYKEAKKEMDKEEAEQKDFEKKTLNANKAKIVQIASFTYH